MADRAMADTGAGNADWAGEPTIAARDEILAFFKTRLASAAGAA